MSSSVYGFTMRASGLEGLLRLRIRTKLFVLVFFLLLGVISTTFVVSLQTFLDDKSDFVKDLTDKMTRVSTFVVQDRIESQRNSLTLFVSTRESLKSVAGRSKKYQSILFSQFSEFNAVMTIENQAQGWLSRWSEVRPSLSWPDAVDSFLLKDIDFEKIEKNRVELLSVDGPNGELQFLIVFKVDLEDSRGSGRSTEAAVIGVISEALFTDITNMFKPEVTNIFVVNSGGQVVAHRESNRLGRKFLDHPVVKDLVSNKKKKSGLGNFLNERKEEVIGSYSNIEGTNLYLVVTTDRSAAFSAAQALLVKVVIIGIVLLFAGVGLAFFFASRITNPLNKLKQVAAEIGAGDFDVPVEVDSKDEVGELAGSIDQMKGSLKERDELLDAQKQALIQSEKMGAFGQLSAGIAHEVKNPLAGILGHAQLAKGKIDAPDIKKHLEVIEKETRRTKEIIENLMKFARAEKADLIPTDLKETVSATCDLVDHQLGLMGVRIYKELQDVPQVNANANQLQQVFLNIMMNAGHAMEKAEKKELYVYTEHVGDLVRIRIQDTGSGIPKEIKEKIFEPFFTTKPAGKGTGLGLSVSFGIIRDHKGKIYIESEMGEGTTFFIDLPLAGKELNESVQQVEQVDVSKTPKESVSEKKIEVKKNEVPESVEAPPIPEIELSDRGVPSAPLDEVQEVPVEKVETNTDKEKVSQEMKYEGIKEGDLKKEEDTKKAENTKKEDKISPVAKKKTDESKKKNKKGKKERFKVKIRTSKLKA